MKTNSTQQEILLMTGTTFASNLLVNTDDPGNNKRLSGKELLEDACWNGLLKEMLPEIYGLPALSGSMYLWRISQAAFFLELELGESPLAADKYFSIDPYSFLATKSRS
jgi:hypothetical protein